MPVSKEKEVLYKQLMEDAKTELAALDNQMQEEIQKIREKLAQLQEAKKSYKKLYDEAAKILGVKVKPEEEKEADDSDSSPPEL